MGCDHGGSREVSRLSRALLAAALLAAGAAAAQPLPQDDGRMHLGTASCRGPVCHTSNEELKSVYGDEWYVWHEDDRHSQAWSVLKNAESKRIVGKLGYDKPATEVDLCLDCHADHVPAAKRGPQFKISQGVGCEACHGGSEVWASRHDDGRPHAENVKDGLYPADEPLARAKLCTSCHYGNERKFVTHRIMGAGHPRMSFDLQVFTRIQPAHFVVDDDYRARGKQDARGAKVWAIGQTYAARASLDALLDPERSRDGVWPELVLFDCFACHHRMSDQRWAPKSSTALLGPGVPRLNDSSFLMTGYAFAAVDPAGAKAFAEDLRLLHREASESAARGQAVATRMRERLDGLLPKLGAWKVDAAAVKGVLRALLADGQKGEFLDYAGAEQASLAVQALFEDLFALGAITEAQLGQVAAENEKLLAAVENPERYETAGAKAAFQRLSARVD